MSPTYRDVYSRYEKGLQAFMEKLDKTDPRYDEALAFQQRLQENIDRARRYGSTDELEADRNEIVALLNDLCQDTLGHSFNELCKGEMVWAGVLGRKLPWPLLLVPIVAAVLVLSLLGLKWAGVWPAQPAPTAVPTPAPSAAPTDRPTAATTTPPPSPTDTPQPSPIPTMAPLSGAVDTDPARYIDNRSGPVEVLQSFYNALNRQEYTRAYSYWNTYSAPTFSQFKEDYKDVAAIQFVVGEVGEEAAAGSIYNNAAVVIVAQTTDGTIQTFTGCYQLHMSRPGNYSDPPVPPLAIEKAVIHQVTDATALDVLLAQACDGSGIPQGRPLSPEPTPGPNDTAHSFYIDNRSGPVEVLQSFCNAINSYEHARAYGYWEDSAAGRPAYYQFTADYANVATVELITGEDSSSGDAELFYRVPAALVFRFVDDTVQTLVGCYTLHMWQADLQTIPPFQPLGIIEIDVWEVDYNADLPALLRDACP